jgi:nitroreductase
MTAEPDHIRLLRRVRQVRDLSPEPIDDDTMRGILEAARWTGSARNQQPWRFVVVRDRETLERIGASGPGIGHASKAGAVIVIAMAGDNPAWNAFDEARAAERILIAVTGYGLSGAIGWIREQWRDEVRGLLGIPGDRAIRTLVSIGRATEEGRKRKSPPGEGRLPLDEVVRWERWS